MKTIAYYISDAGFGHMTRSLAIIEHLLETTEHDIYISGSEVQTDYTKIYLASHLDRIKFDKVQTDARTVYVDHSFEVDVKATEDNIREFLAGLGEAVETEMLRLKHRNVACVVTDLSILGIKVAKALGRPVVGISNYTWYHRYKKYGIGEELIAPYLEAYNEMDKMLTLGLSDSMDGLACPTEQVGFVARKTNSAADRMLRTSYWPSAYVSIGQMANYSEKEIAVDFPDGHVFATGNVKLRGNVHVAPLPARVGNTQDYVASSSMAIIKPGWASVAECLVYGVPFGVVKTNRAEDGEIVEKLVKEGWCFAMDLAELHTLEIHRLYRVAVHLRAPKMPNSVPGIVQRILDMAV
ncbi:hypothetical protein [Anaerotalea alkaliphila]|uniref:Glycosyl transferase family 28 C-terminal domain-containing protein n=1 Tax=Anaerotalea alkaliphila TaxID=2662126 RepID=A0A7X5KNE5_9FIRM|nr:hypothetical protein [Anaerotalea alkaliphila]NDL67713.1 hypothetical protein [Anaerotalea alkaliphila]